MTVGAIPSASQLSPLNTPNAKTPFVYVEGPLAGLLTGTAQQMLLQLVSFVTSMNRIFPCSSTGTDDITLTVIPGGPQIGLFGQNTIGYYDYDVFSAVAANTSSGPVTAHVVTPTRPNAAAFALPTLKVYKGNGASQAGAGDLTQGLHYTWTFVDSLDSGVGGFVLR